MGSKLRIRKRPLLIGLISLTTLGCFLWGIAIYSGWLESSIRKVVYKQVLDDNLQTAKQLTRLFREMNIRDIQVDDVAWDRLQDIVEDIRLPNEGFICVVDCESGFLICHPEMRNNPDLRNVPVGKSTIRVDGFDTDIISTVEPGKSNYSGGVAEIKGETQVVAVAHIPKFNGNLLVHQRESGMKRAIDRTITPVSRIGYGVAFLVAALIAVANFLVIRQYENKLADVNEHLEDLVEKRTRALVKTRNSVIFGLAKLAESRDTDTGKHLERIQSYVTILARRLRPKHPILNENFIDDLALASSLHDIGKVGIPDQVLLKPGRFTPSERQVMERHSVLGGKCLASIQQQLGEDDFLELSTEIAFYHHERWDGTGYPSKKAKTEIPLSARIVALADVYDALTSKRPYKDPMSHDEAMAIIVSGRETHFDPDIVDAFVDTEYEFEQIALSGREGEVALSTVETLSNELIQTAAECQVTS